MCREFMRGHAVMLLLVGASCGGTTTVTDDIGESDVVSDSLSDTMLDATSDAGVDAAIHLDEDYCVVSDLGQGTNAYVQVTCSKPYRVSNLSGREVVVASANQTITVPTHSLIGVMDGENHVYSYVHAAGRRTVPINALASSAELSLHVAALSINEAGSSGRVTQAADEIVGVSVNESLNALGTTLTYDFSNPKMRTALFFRGSADLSEPHMTIVAPRAMGDELILGVLAGVLPGVDLVSSSAKDVNVPVVQACDNGSLTGWAGVVGPLIVSNTCLTASLARDRIDDAWNFAMASEIGRSQFIATQFADTYFLVIRLAYEIAQLSASAVEPTGLFSCLLSLAESTVFEAISEHVIPGLVSAYYNDEIWDVNQLVMYVLSDIQDILENPTQAVINALVSVALDGATDQACVGFVCAGASLSVVATAPAAVCAAVSKIADVLQNGAALLLDVSDICNLGTMDLLYNDYTASVDLPIGGQSLCLSLDCDCEVGSGPCCGSDCRFIGSDHVCDHNKSFVYGCDGEGCGNSVTVIYQDQYCSQDSHLCSGVLKDLEPVHLLKCPNSSMCDVSNVDDFCPVNEELCAAVDDCGGQSLQKPCGSCAEGVQTRTCTDGVLSEWSDCVGHGCVPTTEQVCNGGSGTQICNDNCMWNACETPICEGSDSRSCGDCGMQYRTCNAGTWSSWGTCGNEGECSPDDSEACGSGGTRTCSIDCEWGDCELPSCSAWSIQDSRTFMSIQCLDDGATGSFSYEGSVWVQGSPSSCKVDPDYVTASFKCYGQSTSYGCATDYSGREVSFSCSETMSPPCTTYLDVIFEVGYTYDGSSKYLKKTTAYRSLSCQ